MLTFSVLTKMKMLRIQYVIHGTQAHCRFSVSRFPAGALICSLHCARHQEQETSPLAGGHYLKSSQHFPGSLRQ